MVVLYDDNCTIFDFSHREHPVYLAMCQKPFAVYYKTCQKVYHTLRTASDCRSKRQAFDKLVDNRQKISYTLLWQRIITTFQRHSNRLRSGSISQTVQEVNFAIASLFSLFILFFPCFLRIQKIKTKGRLLLRIWKQMKPRSRIDIRLRRHLMVLFRRFIPSETRTRVAFA